MWMCEYVGWIDTVQFPAYQVAQQAAGAMIDVPLQTTAEWIQSSDYSAFRSEYET